MPQRKLDCADGRLRAVWAVERSHGVRGFNAKLPLEERVRVLTETQLTVCQVLRIKGRLGSADSFQRVSQQCLDREEGARWVVMLDPRLRPALAITNGRDAMRNLER